jgi:hypothetical protein
MAETTASWSDRANVRFLHIPGQDAACTAANTNIVFNVTPLAAHHRNLQLEHRTV